MGGSQGLHQSQSMFVPNPIFLPKLSDHNILHDEFVTFEKLKKLYRVLYCSPEASNPRNVPRIQRKVELPKLHALNEYHREPVTPAHLQELYNCLYGEPEGSSVQLQPPTQGPSVAQAPHMAVPPPVTADVSVPPPPIPQVSVVSPSQPQMAVPQGGQQQRSSGGTGGVGAQSQASYALPRPSWSGNVSQSSPAGRGSTPRQAQAASRIPQAFDTPRSTNQPRSQQRTSYQASGGRGTSGRGGTGRQTQGQGTAGGGRPTSSSQRGQTAPGSHRYVLERKGNG